jgi:hypothetical protein
MHLTDIEPLLVDCNFFNHQVQAYVYACSGGSGVVKEFNLKVRIVNFNTRPL